MILPPPALLVVFASLKPHNRLCGCGRRQGTWRPSLDRKSPPGRQSRRAEFGGGRFSGALHASGRNVGVPVRGLKNLRSYVGRELQSSPPAAAWFNQAKGLHHDGPRPLTSRSCNPARRQRRDHAILLQERPHRPPPAGPLPDQPRRGRADRGRRARSFAPCEGRRPCPRPRISALTSTPRPPAA